LDLQLLWVLVQLKVQWQIKSNRQH
jgi:hypothetical protein